MADLLRYEDPTLGSYIGLLPFRNELLIEQQNGSVTHYTIIWIRACKYCVLDIDFEEVHIKRDAIVFLSPYQRLNIKKGFPDSGVSICFNHSFCTELHREEAPCNGLLFNGTLPSVIHNPDNKLEPELDLLIKIMEREFKKKDEMQEEMLRILLKQMVIHCTRSAKNVWKQKYSLNNTSLNTVRQFSALVEQHFREKRKVSDYATLLNKSAKTISNLFHTQSSKSPKAVIRDRIILESKRLLIHSNKSVKEIAHELGFENPADFSRYFTNATGLSPQYFRNHIEKEKL
ncbi:helix-turn-helix domain-containing protein [Fulvivirgaceae bacterium BMA10]|uniref:Helix-turn-helix domain-containing protein n=1 Tax=Splendidivirga corallicola TaxID=3051826 RepID=A0ABT8KVK7_9BACT|nr:helix-turn-helix domain-containing protein [Fulvivirgaceae bacterium BMA10]